MEKTIIDLVEEDVALQAELQAILDAKYLAPGVFHPRAYLINDVQVRSRWKKRCTRSVKRVDLIAIGVAIYNQFFHEAYVNYLSGEDATANRNTTTWLSDWEREIEERFPGDESIPDVAAKLGQYLEFINRKSQGY